LFGLKPVSVAVKARNRLKLVSPICVKFDGSGLVGRKPAARAGEDTFHRAWLISEEASRYLVSAIMTSAGKQAQCPKGAASGAAIP
jgi:hypothetical protein